MPVRIFCQCGAEVTNAVSMWDRKTRSVFWMDQHAPSCAACLKQPRAVSSVKRAWEPGLRGVEARRKAAAR